MKTTTISASFAMGTVLAACGGSTTDMTGAPQSGIPASAPIAFATSSATTSDTLLDGQLLPTRVYSLQDDETTREVRPANLITNIGFDEQNQKIEIEINGISRSIDISGNDPNVEITTRYAGQYNPYAVFLVYQNSLNDFANGNALLRYAVPFYIYGASTDNQELYRSYGVVGAQTPGTYFENNTATATYNGGFAAQNWVPFQVEESRHNLLGTSTINVDFASQTVTGGQFTVNTENMAATDYASAPRSGVFIIGPSSFGNSDQEFTSTLSSNVPGLTLDPGATIKGGFYGDTAQEIGGALQYEGVLDGKDVIAAGPFTGVKN